MTYGVDNPTYVAFNEMKMDKKDEKESHYEVIGNIDDENAENFEESPQELTEKTVDSKVEEICVTNDLLNIAETIITEGEKVENETFDNINLS